MVPRLRTSVWLLTAAILPAPVGRVRAAEPVPPPLGRTGKLILSENAYCRAHYQFGWDRIDSKVLRERGKEVLGAKDLRRLERDVKRRLAHRKLDWSKVDWRDHAVVRYVTISHHMAQSAELLEACSTPPAAAGWTAPDFDDAAWPRFTKPFAVGPETGMYFSQWSVASPGLQAAYLRFRFDVPDPAKAGDVTLWAEYVGGARFFVNGKEVARGHLPEGEVTPRTVAEGYSRRAYLRRFDELRGKDLADAKKRLKGKAPPEYWGYANWYALPGSRLYRDRNRRLGPVKVPAALLRKGPNVLAVAVHQAPLHPMVVYEHAWISGYGRSQTWLHATLSRLELRATGDVPSAVRRPTGVQVWAADPHRRLFVPEYLEPGAPPGAVRFVAARGGSYGAQLVVGTDRELRGVKLSVSDLAGPGGARIPGDAVRVFGMATHSGKTAWQGMGMGRIGGNNFFTLPGWGSPSEYAAYVRFVKPRGKDGTWERARFFEQITHAVPATVAADSCRPYWLRLGAPRDAEPGAYRGEVRVSAAGGQVARVPVQAEIADWTLPESKAFQTIAAVEQSPYGVAKAYRARAAGAAKAEPGAAGSAFALWSEEHFRYLVASIRELGRVGNDWWFVPVIHYTEFGNADDSMVLWNRHADGRLSFDFRILDRYLDLIEKHCGRPRVVAFVVMHGAAGPVEVTVTDVATGKPEKVSLGGSKYDPAVRRRYWHAFARAVQAHMRRRGLGDALHWGYAWDTEGDPRMKDLLREVAPDVFWTFGAHSRGAKGSGGGMSRESLRYYKSISNIYGPVPGLRSRMGWKRRNVYLLNPRMLSSCSSTEGHAPPFNYRLMVDRALVAGHNGLGRVGGDYWGAYYEHSRVGAWHQASFSILTTLWPGRDGAEPGARYEAFLEGIQEAEARIYMEQALDRDLLPADLAERTRAVLRDHNGRTLHIPVHVSAHQLTEGARGWRARSRRLYGMAAEVARTVGLDVDRRDFRAELAPRGQTELTVRLRNWTAKPRAWRARANVEWIVPEKTEGALTGVQPLVLRLTGRSLEAGATATGTVTITDVAGDRQHPVRITARVNPLMEVPIRSVILNVPAGAEAAREGLMVLNTSGGELAWKVDSPAAWLRAEPTEGTVAPGAGQAFRLVAAPPEKSHAVHSTTVTVRAGGAAEPIAVTTYVMPAYRKPARPAGTPFWLLGAVGAKWVRHTSHTMGGYNHAENMKRPPEKRRAHDGWWQTGPMYRGHGLPGMWRNVHGADMSRLAYRIGERVYCRGLWAYPYHETTYAFGKPGIAAFTAEVAFAPKLRRGRADRSVAVNFEIYVDGTLRTQSGLMRAGDEPRLLAVDGLADAETLRLVTRRQDGVNDLRMLTVWADPTFYAPQPPAHLAALYEASRQLLTDPPGTPVRRWAVLGPFDPGGKRFSVYHREGIERDPYLGGKELDFSATHDGKDGRKLRWRAVETGEDGMMDLAKALGGEAEETVSYACATIESDRDRPIQLGVGACSPDHHNAFHVWLNGKTLHGQGGTGRKPNAVRVVGRLKKGRNLLIVRLIEVMRTKDPALIVTYRADGVTVRPPEGVDRR